MKQFNPQPKPNYTEQKIAKVKAEDAAYETLLKEVYRIHGKRCYSGNKCLSKILRRPDSVTPGHILPRGREGRIDTIENIIPQCKACNGASMNGTDAYGKRMTGDEFTLMILEQHEKEPGFIHQAEIEYLRRIVEKQQIERVTK